MNLFEYIKSQLPSMPNVAIMKDMGASDELIEYIRHTTWNTNLGMLSAYGCEPSGGGTDTVTITVLDYSGAVAQTHVVPKGTTLNDLNLDTDGLCPQGKYAFNFRLADGTTVDFDAPFEKDATITPICTE